MKAYIIKGQFIDSQSPDALRIVGFIILPDWMAKPFQAG